MFINQQLPKKITMHTLKSAQHDKTKISFKPKQFVGLCLDPSPDWGATLILDHGDFTEEYTISDEDAFSLMWLYAILKAKFSEAIKADE